MNLNNEFKFYEFKQTPAGEMFTFFSHSVSEEFSVCHVRNLDKMPQLPSGFSLLQVVVQPRLEAIFKES